MPHSSHTQPFEARRREIFPPYSRLYQCSVYTLLCVATALHMAFSGILCVCKESINLAIKKKTACFCALAAVCMCANESRGGWSVVGPCGGVMESSSDFSVECV